MLLDQRINAAGGEDKINSLLGSSDKERQIHYRALVAEGLGEQQVETIRLSLNKGIVLDDVRFADQIATLTGKRLATGKPGRPEGWRKNKDNSL